MEFDRELYQRTFSRLKASPEKIQEVIHMTENRKIKKTARRALAAVAVTALAALTAMGQRRHRRAAVRPHGVLHPVGGRADRRDGV